MDRVEKLKKTLAEEYGIHTEEEFMKAFNEMPKIDMSVFTADPKKCMENRKGKKQYA